METIFQEALAAEFSGYAGKIRCFLARRVLKQFVLIHLFLKQALKQTRSVCLRVAMLSAQIRNSCKGGAVARIHLNDGAGVTEPVMPA
jgi:hypothetical protein